ncbi:hypothetical protein [Mycolicibacter sinensis]|nr:hypothetical protein [Mycolicibacter sinensis]
MAAGDSSSTPSDELTVRREDAKAEQGIGSVYRTDDGRILTFNEVFDELTPEIAENLPPGQTVIDGGEVLEWMVEGGSGYAPIDADGRIVTLYSDGRNRWTVDELRQQIYPAVTSAASFDDWLSASVTAGDFRSVDVLQFVGYADEDSDGQTVLTERLILD